MKQQLSKLRSLDPHSVWEHEAHDFTPWLLDNDTALAEVLGIDLELTANEHPVGSFALDLIGWDITNDCVLIVENQLTGTDHGHLGQLLTYAAGTDATTVIWMATSFREEHRQALDWLNNLAAGNPRFFGIEIGAVQIADSPPAPLFKVRAQPNDWHSHTASVAKSATSVAGKASYYRQFWELFLNRIQIEHSGWTNSKKPSASNWLAMPSPIKGGPAYVSSFAAGGHIRSELYVDFLDGHMAKSLFAYLLGRQKEIETIYGSPLSWEELPGRRASRIADYADGDVVNVDKHDQYISWLFEAGAKLRNSMADAASAWNGLTEQERNQIGTSYDLEQGAGDEDLPGFQGWTDQGTPIHE